MYIYIYIYHMNTPPLTSKTAVNIDHMTMVLTFENSPQGEWRDGQLWQRAALRKWTSGVCVCVCECVWFLNHVTLTKEACHTCRAHVTLMNESCRTLTHMWHMCVTWLFMCVTWRHDTHVSHMSHLRMSHVAHMNDSSLTQCVSYMWTRGAHVTHMVGVTWLILNHSFWNHSYVTWYEIIHMCHDTKSFVWVRKNAWMNSCHVTDERNQKKLIAWMNSCWNPSYVTWREITHMWHDVKSFICYIIWNHPYVI